MTTNFGLSPKALVTDVQQRVLVIRRSAKSTHWPGQWDLPGGKMDPGETFDQALVREAKEEAGLDIELTGFVGAAEYELSHIRVVFLVMTARITGGALQLSKEHGEHRWVGVDALRDLDLVEPIATAIQASVW